MIDMNEEKRIIRKETGHPKSSLKYPGHSGLLIILMFLLLFASTFTYCMPYSYIGIDINPGVELTVNIYDRVIEIKSTNDDGRYFEDRRDYHHRKYGEIIQNLIRDTAGSGFLDNEDDLVFVTVLSKGNPERIIEDVEKVIPQINEEIDVYVIEVTAKERQRALADNISTGKMILLDMLKGDHGYEEYINVAFRDIVDRLNESKGNNSSGLYGNKNNIQSIMNDIVEKRKSVKGSSKGNGGGRGK